MATTNAMTVTSDTTLGDLNQNDRANFKEAVLKRQKTFAFPGVIGAREFMGDAFNNIMRRCGIKIKRGDHKAHIDKQLKKHGIRVEHRTYPPEEQLYRSGLFIYKRGEMMGFVSSPFVKVSGLYTPPKYFIMTTEREM